MDDINNSVNYMTKKQAAAYLQVHPETIGKWVKQGRLVAYKGEKIIRFKKEDLDKLMAPVKA